MSAKDIEKTIADMNKYGFDLAFVDSLILYFKASKKQKKNEHN
jgi:hypothetical protein